MSTRTWVIVAVAVLVVIVAYFAMSPQSEAPVETPRPPSNQPNPRRQTDKPRRGA